MNFFKFSFLALFLFSCAGYRVQPGNNPFAQYNIERLSVPMFVNKTTIAGISGTFTSKFVLFLSRFSGLSVTSGESDSSDAELLGILESPVSLRETVAVDSSQFTTEALEESIGGRAKLYVPRSSRLNLVLRLMLIRRSNADGMKKVVFDRRFNLTMRFGRIIADTINSDSGGTVNYTKNRTSLYDTVDQLAQVSVNRFRDLIINVF